MISTILFHVEQNTSSGLAGHLHSINPCLRLVLNKQEFSGSCGSIVPRGTSYFRYCKLKADNFINIIRD